MIEGHVVNVGVAHNIPAVWMAGKRQEALTFIGWNFPDELEWYYLTTTYRCEQCGYLESYATVRHY